MSRFDEFKKTHGPGEKCRRATGDVVGRYQNRLPAALIEEWREAGWCGYGDGLIWLVNPAELEDVLADWLDPAEGHLVIARTSFSDLLLWSEKGLHYLHTVYGGIAYLTDRIDLYFNAMLTTDEYLDDAVDRPLHRRAVKKLGRLEHDQCYGFEPAVALGGPGTLETLRIVKLREHLGLLAQLTDGLREV